jgi:hypothetical protein
MAQNIKVGLINGHSVVDEKRAELVRNYIADNALDALAITESWICTADDDATKSRMAPTGFGIAHIHRLGATTRRRGGGLCFIHRDSWTVQPNTWQTRLHYTSFEYQLLDINITASNRHVVTTIIYRPPSGSITDFNNDLDDLLRNKYHVEITNDNFLMCGDFNCR